MATQTINTRTFVNPTYTSNLGDRRQYENVATLEMDTSSGVLTLAVNGTAVSAVAPNADSSLVTLTAGGTYNMPARDFYELVFKSTGSISTLNPPPSRAPGEPFFGWAVARLLQASVTLDTILRIPARSINQ